MAPTWGTGGPCRSCLEGQTGCKAHLGHFGRGTERSEEGRGLSTKHCSAERLGMVTNSGPQTSGVVSRAHSCRPNTCANNDTPNFMGLEVQGTRKWHCGEGWGHQRREKDLVAERQTCDLPSTWGFAERKLHPTIQELYF